jgi:hypothetical protein
MEEQALTAVPRRMLVPRILDRLDTHELTAALSLERGSAGTLDAGASPRTEGQDRGLLDSTVTRLNTLRKQHFYKSASS